MTDMKNKKIYRAMMILALAGALAGCGKQTESTEENTTQSTTEDMEANVQEDSAGADSESETADIDVQVVADGILQGGDFKDNLAAVDTTLALTRVYDLDAGQVEASAFYTNSNATAEEIAVIKTVSADYVDTVKTAYEDRIASQKEACRDYLPDEMTKLDAAVIYTNGNYVVLCVSNDSTKAEQVIADLFK